MEKREDRSVPQNGHKVEARQRQRPRTHLTCTPRTLARSAPDCLRKVTERNAPPPAVKVTVATSVCTLVAVRATTTSPSVKVVVTKAAGVRSGIS